MTTTCAFGDARLHRHIIRNVRDTIRDRPLSLLTVAAQGAKAQYSRRFLSPPQIRWKNAMRADTLLVGTSAHIQDLRRGCAMLGPRRRNVVIEGETGTGKGLVA